MNDLIPVSIHGDLRAYFYTFRDLDTSGNRDFSYPLRVLNDRWAVKNLQRCLVRESRNDVGKSNERSTFSCFNRNGRTDRTAVAHTTYHA